MLSDLKPRVLLAEDDHLAAMAMETFLSWSGCQVTVAHDGLEALAAAAEAAFDVLLTDLMMPRLDGRGLIQSLKSEHPDLPVVVVTGDPTLIQPEELRAYGRMALLTKPVQPPQLAEAIRSVLLDGRDSIPANAS